MPHQSRVLTPMVEHVGKSLKAFLEQTAIKPSRLLKELPFSEETMFRHFRSKDLHTSVLRRYEMAFGALRVQMSASEVLAGNVEVPIRTVTDYQRKSDELDAMAKVSQLLKEAAEVIDKQTAKAT